MANARGFGRASTLPSFALPSLSQAVNPALVTAWNPVSVMREGRRRLRVPKLRGYIRDRRTKLKKVGSERVSEVVKAESRQPRPGEVCTGAFAIAVLVLAGCASMHNGQVPRALDKLRRRRTRW